MGGLTFAIRCRSNFEKGTQEPGTAMKACHTLLDSCVFQQILLRVCCRSGICALKVILYQGYQKHCEAFDGEFAAMGQAIEGTPSKRRIALPIVFILLLAYFMWPWPGWVCFPRPSDNESL